MSVIDQARHNVVTYVAKETKAFAGQRLSVHHWKTNNNKESVYYGIKRESKAVSINPLTQDDIKENIQILMPHVIDYFHSVQDKLIKEKLESADNISSIGNEEFSLAACVEYLESSNESGRLTKESVAAWFDATISDSLSLALAERLGVSENPTDEESAKVFKIVSAFKDKVSSLSSGKTILKEQEAKQVKKCLEFADDNDVMASRFKARIEKMLEKPQDDLLNAL